MEKEVSDLVGSANSCYVSFLFLRNGDHPTIPRDAMRSKCPRLLSPKIGKVQRGVAAFLAATPHLGRNVVENTDKNTVLRPCGSRLAATHGFLAASTSTGSSAANDFPPASNEGHTRVGGSRCHLECHGQALSRPRHSAKRGHSRFHYHLATIVEGKRVGATFRGVCSRSYSRADGSGGVRAALRSRTSSSGRPNVFCGGRVVIHSDATTIQRAVH